MKIFLTGGTGFIGGALARRLGAGGHEVAALARRPDAASAPPGVQWVRGDISEPEGWSAEASAALAGAEAVAHLAAVRKDWSLDDEALDRVNVLPGPALRRGAARAEHFLFVSSVAVHGHPEPGRPGTEDSPFAPSKRYGESKVRAEQALRAAEQAEDGPAVTIARPGVTYGPGDTYGMVANLARLVSAGRFLQVGSGRNRLCLLHVDDLAIALEKALLHPAAAGRELLVTGARPCTFAELRRSVEEAVGRRVPPLRMPAWAAFLAAKVLETAWRWADLKSEPFLTKAKVDLVTSDDVWDPSRTRELLEGWPERDLTTGVAETVAWLREAGEIS